MFSLLLQASFWRLQIQFCGSLMCFLFFFQDPFKSLGVEEELLYWYSSCLVRSTVPFLLPHPGLSLGPLSPRAVLRCCCSNPARREPTAWLTGQASPAASPDHVQSAGATSIFLCCLQPWPDALPPLRAGQGETGSSPLLSPQHL